MSETHFFGLAVNNNTDDRLSFVTEIEHTETKRSHVINVVISGIKMTRNQNLSRESFVVQSLFT